MGGARGLCTLVALCAFAVVPAAADAFTEYEGAVHEHTAYSDGEPGKRPADAYAAVRAKGGKFMVSTEHSDTEYVPIVTNTKCLSARALECIGGDATNPPDALRKWQATEEQTNAATDANFVGIRGFEWTNDRHGHLNVLFSRNTTNAKIDLGYVSMDFFWNWFTRPVAQGGGADALATFNHPGAREIGELLPGGFIAPLLPDILVPGGDWDSFKFIPKADSRMVGMELFNGGSDYGDADNTHPAGSYGFALDKGWHIGAIGAEDTHDTSWGNPDDRKTVMLADELTRGALRGAFEARRFYAVKRSGVRLTFTADGEPMGSRLTRAPGTPIELSASSNVAGAQLELVTSGGAVVAQGNGALAVSRAAATGERWYFVRVRNAEGQSVAYSSPVWVTAETP